jgi:hypothetical protein
MSFINLFFPQSPQKQKRIFSDFFLFFFLFESPSVACKFTSNSIGILDNPAMKLEVGSTIPS